MVFSIRSSALGDLQRVFFDPTDPLHAASKVTSVAGIAFLGFAVSVFFGSPLCDALGMGRLLALASVLFIGGTSVTIFAAKLAGSGDPFWISGAALPSSVLPTGWSKR